MTTPIKNPARGLRTAGSVQSNAFNPTQLNGCTVWLRGDRGVTNVAGNCSAWSDLSGVGNNVAQGVAGNRPIIVPVSGNLNGRETFDCATTRWLAGAFAAYTAAVTMAAVSYLVGAGVGGTAASTAGGVVLTGVGLLSNIFVGGSVSLNRVATATTTAAGQPVKTVLVGVATVNRGDLCMNSKVVTTPSAVVSTMPAQDTFVAGSIQDSVGNAFDGEIAEIVVYNRVLTAAEIARLVYYLGVRYNIPVAA